MAVIPIEVNLHFCTADTKDTSIIAYGYILGVKMFKVVYKKEKYELLKLFGVKYNHMCYCNSLNECMSIAAETYNNVQNKTT